MDMSWVQELSLPQEMHALHYYTAYPPQSSSVTSSNGSASPPQEDYASRQLNYNAQSSSENNYYDYQLPAVQTTPIKTDYFHLSQFQRNCLRCYCLNCRNELAGLPPVVPPDAKGRRQHVCHFAGCFKLFLRTTHLKIHVRQHTGERPFVCSYCRRAFVRSDELQRHLRIHTGDKKYNCSICTKKFMRSDHLKKHIKSHENDEHRQSDSVANGGNYGSLPQPIYAQELSILSDHQIPMTTNGATSVYANSPMSSMPFYTHPLNQTSTLDSYQHNNPNVVNYGAETSGLTLTDHLNGTIADSQHESTTSASAYNKTNETYPYGYYHTNELQSELPLFGHLNETNAGSEHRITTSASSYNETNETYPYGNYHTNDLTLFGRVNETNAESQHGTTTSALEYNETNETYPYGNYHTNELPSELPLFDHLNETNTGSGHGTNYSSAYGGPYTYDNYHHHDPSQAELYHTNYRNCYKFQ